MEISSVIKNIILLLVSATVVGVGASFSVNDIIKAEGTGGHQYTKFTFTVTLAGDCIKNVQYKVNVGTQNGTASEPGDYTDTYKTITIKPNATGICNITEDFDVYVNPDGGYEPDETFYVKLSNSINADISDDTGIGTILNDDTKSPEVEFVPRYRTNIRGNLKTIGNSNLWNDTDGNTRNIKYADIDNNKLVFSPNSTFNSSFAVLEDSVIASPTAAKIKWAGLYWTGFLHPGSTGSGDYKTLSDIDAVEHEIDNHSVVFYHNGDKDTITSQRTVKLLVSHINGNHANYGYFYNCFADVTSLVQDRDPRAEYGVANIPAMVSATVGDYGADGDEAGGWSLVVVYENNSEGEKTRNLSIFDGFKKIIGNEYVSIDVHGFKTPKTAEIIDSTLSAFAAGATWSLNDGIIFTNTDGTKAGQSAQLHSSQATDFFDNTITGVPNREPILPQKQTPGIDIHTAQIGNSTADGYNILGNIQSKANIKLYTVNDVYYPSVVAFATEIYMPRFCYDYTSNLDGEIMQMASGDRTYYPHKDSGTLMSKVFIRNLEGDFPYLRTKFKATWSNVDATSSATFRFKKPALVQNPHTYAYFEPEYIDDVNGEYYIGWDNTDKGGYEGTIDALESVYTISNFDAYDLQGSTIQLNATINASVAFDETDPSVLTNFTFSTSDGTLEVCPGEVMYNPRWYEFNVESPSADPNYPYALNTQVTGTDFSLKIASYSKDVYGNYTVPTPYTGAMEVELFEVPTFQSLGVIQRNQV
jgi:hypothetical protein